MPPVLGTEPAGRVSMYSVKAVPRRQGFGVFWPVGSRAAVAFWCLGAAMASRCFSRIRPASRGTLNWPSIEPCPSGWIRK